MALSSVIREDINNILDREIQWERLYNKSVLISGANGFIASYLIYTLIALNERKNAGIKIFGLARNPEKMKLRYGELLEREDFFCLIQDAREPLAETQGSIDFIIHAASQTGPEQFVNDPVGTALTNIQGTVNLLEFAKLKDIKCFLLLSTREIYGSGDKEFVREEDVGSLDPALVRSCYPEAKRMSETLCASYGSQYGIPCKIARIAHTYGPGMVLGDGRVVGDFLKNVLEDSDIVLNSDGSGILALTYISDIVAGLFMLICNFDGFVYNIADSDEVISVKGLAETLCEVFSDRNIKTVFNIWDESMNSGYLKRKPGILDSSKAIGSGWKPQYSLREGMARTIKHYEERTRLTKG